MVFIAPVRKRKPFLFCGMISEPRVAACPDPIPGRKEQRGAETKEAKKDLNVSFLDKKILRRGEIICFLLIDFFSNDVIMVDKPKSPVKRGIKG